MKLRSLGICLLLLTGRTMACDCEWQGPFSWLVDDADSILAGEVVSHSGNSLDLRIEQRMQGVELASQVRVWGSYESAQCRADVADFPVGSRWVLVLSQIAEVPAGGFNPSTPNISYGRVGDYALSRCGAYWLKLENSRASGNITSVFEWDYAPEMKPVPLELIQRFIDGKASYSDIISESEEITSGEVMMRKSKRALGIGSEWDAP